MLRMLAIIFGVVFIVIGAAGYSSHFVTDGLLFGLFEVDSLHNLIHIATGVIAIMCATSYTLTKSFFKIFGIIYFIVAIVGFAHGGDVFIMHVNMADNFLHLVLASVAIYLGFTNKAG